MNCVGKRQRRKPSTTTETTNDVPRKWSEEEMKILYEGLMKHGHKNFAEFQKLLPDRSLDNIKCFMRTVYDTAVKSSQGHRNIDAWINRCSSACLNETQWKNSSFVAKVMKYLSVDGLLENHPLPERCNGINFSEAYRIIYQALMGYPMQPVNEATCDFVTETLKELVNDATVEKEATEKLKSFLIENLNFKEKGEPQTQTINPTSTPTDRKSEKVYQRKRQKVMEDCDSQAPAVKIVVVPNKNQECENSNMKEFLVTVENKERGHVMTVTNVAVPVTTQSEVTSEVPPIVPCYNGKALKIHEELVGNGLSAISIKHHKGNCKDEKKISKRDTKTKPTKKKAKENKENEGHSKKSSGICYKDFPETAEVPECLKDKMKRRNSFWNVHRPDLSKLTWPENFVSSAVLQDFFHNHLRIHGTFCEPLHESNNRSSILDEEIRDFSKLREIAPPRILPPDEKIVNIMEKSRSLQLNDEDLDPETQVHKSRAEFCVTIGEYIRRPLVKRTISQQMTKSPLQPANRFESLPVQHEGLLSKETMLSEERISAVIGSLDFSPVGNSSKKSSKGGSANFSTAAYKRGSTQDSQRSPPSRNTLSIMGEFSDHSQVTEDSGDPARLRTILSPRDETAGCSESRHNKV